MEHYVHSLELYRIKLGYSEELHLDYLHDYSFAEVCGEFATSDVWKGFANAII